MARSGDRQRGTDGIDTLESIERLQFTDRTTLVDGTTAPPLLPQDDDTFMFRDDEMIQPHTGQSPDIVADGGNDVILAEKLQVDMPTASLPKRRRPLAYRCRIPTCFCCNRARG